MHPLRELKKFSRVFIEKSDKKTVEFTLGYNDLGYYDRDGNYIAEKGKFEVYIGENALTMRKAEIKII